MGRYGLLGKGKVLKLEETLQKYFMAESFFHGYVAVVEEDELTNGFWLSIQEGAMPPYYAKQCKTLAAVKEAMKDSFFPQPVAWHGIFRRDS